MTATYPLEYDVDYPARKLNRLTSAFRILMAIPIVIVLTAIAGFTEATTGGGTTTVVASGSAVLFLPPLLMIVFRGKYPRWWYDFNVELLRFQNRVGVYVALMDDRYPSTDERQSVRLDVAYPDAKGLRRRPLHRRRHRGRHRLVRDPRHGPLPAADLRLPRRRRPLDESRHRLRVHAHDRPVPAVPAAAMSTERMGRSGAPSPRRVPTLTSAASGVGGRPRTQARPQGADRAKPRRRCTCVGLPGARRLDQGADDDRSHAR
jgi:hypothetical protein